MLKKQAIFLIVLISVVAFSSLAWSAVVGEWNVTGEVTVTVSLKIKGFHKVKTTEPFSDIFTFNSVGGAFAMTDMAGHWSSNKTKFFVELNVPDVENYYGDALLVDATVTSLKFKGSERKDGTIKGTYTMKMNIDVPARSANGKVTVKGNFTGTRTTLQAGAGKLTGTRTTLRAGAGSDFSQEQTLSEAIAQKVFDVISLTD